MSKSQNTKNEQQKDLCITVEKQVWESTKKEYTGKLRIVIRNGSWYLQQEVVEVEENGATAIYWQSVEVVNEDVDSPMTMD